VIEVWGVVVLVLGVQSVRRGVDQPQQRVGGVDTHRVGRARLVGRGLGIGLDPVGADGVVLDVDLRSDHVADLAVCDLLCGATDGVVEPHRVRRERRHARLAGRVSDALGALGAGGGGLGRQHGEAGLQYLYRDVGAVAEKGRDDDSVDLPEQRVDVLVHLAVVFLRELRAGGPRKGGEFLVARLAGDGARYRDIGALGGTLRESGSVERCDTDDSYS